MVTHRIVTLLLALTAGLQAAPPESPALNQAEVRLPYAELRRLIDAGSRAGSESSARPPIPSALLSARYRLGNTRRSSTGSTDTFNTPSSATPSYPNPWTAERQFRRSSAS